MESISEITRFINFHSGMFAITKFSESLHDLFCKNNTLSSSIRAGSHVFGNELCGVPLKSVRDLFIYMRDIYRYTKIKIFSNNDERNTRTI